MIFLKLENISTSFNIINHLDRFTQQYLQSGTIWTLEEFVNRTRIPMRAKRLNTQSMGNPGRIDDTVVTSRSPDRNSKVQGYDFDR